MSRSIVWPTVGLWSASTPGGDVILLLGPEPALRWRMFSEQIMAAATKFEASMLLTLGALLADVPHSRPVQLMGTATDQTMIDRFDLQRSRYEGPTGIVGVLHDAAASHDLASASLWAAVPAYASQVPSPKAALALVERACEMLGCPASTARLVADAGEYDARVSAFVGDDDDLIGYVSRLESLADSGQLDDEDDEMTTTRPAGTNRSTTPGSNSDETDGRGRTVPARPGRQPALSRPQATGPATSAIEARRTPWSAPDHRSLRTPSDPTSWRRHVPRQVRRGSKPTTAGSLQWVGGEFAAGGRAVKQEEVHANRVKPIRWPSMTASSCTGSHSIARLLVHLLRRRPLPANTRHRPSRSDTARCHLSARRTSRTTSLVADHCTHRDLRSLT